MGQRQSGRCRRVVARLAVLLGMGLGPVSGVLEAAAQTSPAPPAQDGSFDGVLRALKLKSDAAPAPAFVTRSRPDAGKLDYIPVGRQHPERTDKVLSPAEVSALTADLDASREKQQRKAGLRPARVPDKPTKAPAVPVRKAIR